MSDTAHIKSAQWRRPTPWSQARFAAKTAVLRLRRTAIDLAAGPQRLAKAPAAGFTTVLARCETPLEAGAPPQERAFELGKIENLRQGARRLDGVVVPAGGVFSFWRQMGPATASRGFVVGRMLQEGCLVPAIGGGLCQLSNGLFEAALQSGCEIVERHRHSRRVPGSAAAVGRDATVAWNYVDLRFRAPRTLRLSVTLEAGQLRIAFLGDPTDGPAAAPSAFDLGDGPQQDARSCATCDEVDCHRHEGPAP